jgi:hypothetical protein
MCSISMRVSIKLVSLPGRAMRCESLLCRELLHPRYRSHGLYCMRRWILLAIDWYACFCESESGEWVMCG